MCWCWQLLVVDFCVLVDYTPLRNFKKEDLTKVHQRQNWINHWRFVGSPYCV